MNSNTTNRRKAVLAGHSGDYKLANSLLNDENEKVRGAALSALEKMGKLSGKILEKFIQDPSPEVRKRTIELLAKRPEKIPLNILDDKDSLVVETACWAIGEKENPIPQRCKFFNSFSYVTNEHHFGIFGYEIGDERLYLTKSKSKGHSAE